LRLVSRNLNPCRLIDVDTEDSRSFLQCSEHVVSIVEISISVDHRPLILLEYEGLSVREPFLFIVLPLSLVILGVQDLAVVQLLALDLGKVLVDLDVPVVEDLGLREHSGS